MRAASVLLSLLVSHLLLLHSRAMLSSRARLSKSFGNRPFTRTVHLYEAPSPVPDKLISSPDLHVSGDLVLHGSDAPPTADELSNENMLRVILSMCSDMEVNLLVWKCLGYRRVVEEGVAHEEDPFLWKWDNTECFPKWRERFPSPPDFVGILRTYTKEIDGPVMKANQALVRTVPMQYKQSIREHLRPMGFNGFKLDELTPNKTRRAQCANWMLYYREALWGVPLEELQRRKELERNVEEENVGLRKEGKSIKVARPDGKQMWELEIEAAKE